MGRQYTSTELVGDFETTVYDGQTDTQVWASAVCEIGRFNAKVLHSINETWAYLRSIPGNITIWYHNLKFDGSFWLNYFLKECGYSQAYTLRKQGDLTTASWNNKWKMWNKQLMYMISNRGQWYNIVVKIDGRFITFKDSYKLLPFSVKDIGKSFKTQHQKLEMEYTGYRYPGCIITPEEEQYIKNDVYVMSEAMQIMKDDGHTGSTIGSCCMAEFKKSKEDDIKNLREDLEYRELFPNLYEILIDKNFFGDATAGDFIRHSYRGGWCYLVPEKANKIWEHGLTADVNSLYPSVMHSDSGNAYPIGKPIFFRGEIPDIAYGKDKYYFVKIRTRFYIKQGYLPFIQVKGTLRYRGTENLTTSDIYDNKLDTYRDYWVDREGVRRPATVDMVVTKTDYERMKEFYDLVDLQVIGGCWFYTKIGIFDTYINKYAEIKMTNTGAKRTEAKLFLNNLYGRLCQNTDSSFKVAYIGEQGELKFVNVTENEKTPGYIACGSAVTSFARDFTIRHAQQNYHGPCNSGFIYADTDSIHCDLGPDILKGIRVHATAFNSWKLESYWDTAIFVRQKTYIEHITHADGKAIENPYYDVKCAGMPKSCKELFIKSFNENRYEVEKENYKQTQLDFLFDEHRKPIIRSMTDFKVGLTVPGKLMPRQIAGGTLLMETTFQMR